MIPVLKALIAHYREDPVWAEVRPPFTEMPAEEKAKAVAQLASEYGFRLSFPKSD
jgi:dihydrodipicolinate synthase/N-acetylneuraminate lyase